MRILVSGDFHCGSSTGLTPSPKTEDERQLFAAYQEDLAWFHKRGRPDISLFMGDGTDGEDPKSNDVRESCMFSQAQQCAELIAMQRPTKEIIIITGTRYHTANYAQEFEIAIKAALESKHLIDTYDLPPVNIVRKLRTTINGWFNLVARHKIGRSSIPHGRATGALRFKTWEVLRAAITSQQKGDMKWPHLCLFGHAHLDIFVKDRFGAAAIVPCYQAPGSKYGLEQCEGGVDIGIGELTIGEERGWSWNTTSHHLVVEEESWVSR